MNEPTWITLNEAASRARCSPKIIYREARDGRLRHTRIGNRLRFLPAWVDQWMMASATPPTGEVHGEAV